ncbi:glycosyltransferase [Vibrio furnissii]|uniref:glycosyltransferase n=1 Tax=Vibrio furnissii TaxID=29494 RepID=UPI003AA87D4F
MSISNVKGLEEIRVAVIMSVYYKDSEDRLSSALDSILRQEEVSVDIYLQVDGVVSGGLYDCLKRYADNESILIEYSNDNKGLACQLNNAISRVKMADKSYDYLARMDADDFSYPNRFIEQIDFLKINNDVSFCGTYIREIHDDGTQFIKTMPSEEDVLNRLIFKCPLNHPTVMFDLSIINFKDLVYKSELKNTQDYYLWVDLLCKGYKLSNVPEVLLDFTVDKDFYSRRGWGKAINEFNSRVYAMKKLKLFSLKNVFISLCLFAFRLSPSYFKSLGYKYLR